MQINAKAPNANTLVLAAELDRRAASIETINKDMGTSFDVAISVQTLQNLAGLLRAYVGMTEAMERLHAANEEKINLLLGLR